MRVYLDCCCFNRPFDDPEQDRVTVEAEAVIRVLSRVDRGDWELVKSDAVLFELRRMRDPVRREACLAMSSVASAHVRTSTEAIRESKRIASLSFGKLDAAHLAFAFLGKVQVFLTVDDRLLRKARSLEDTKIPLVANPAAWMIASEKGELS